MTEDDHFILQACEQHGFVIDGDFNTYNVTPENLIAMIKRARQQGRLDAAGMLTKAAEQFRFYEQQHLAKIPDLQEQLHEHRGGKRVSDLIEATTEKARVNAELAQELEDFLTC